MKTSPITASQQNISWKIPAGLLAIALWSTPAQAAGCACSSKDAKAGASGVGAASCCGDSSSQKSDVACGCGSAQGQGAHSHSTKQAAAPQSGQGAELAGYAKSALAALQQGDTVLAESILETQHKQANAANTGKLKLGVATDLMKLAMNLRAKEQQIARRNAMDRGLALVNEAIEDMNGREKATTLIYKALILKRINGDEVEIQQLLDTAREIDPENPGLLRYARLTSHPERS